MKREIEAIIWQAKLEADSNWLKATQTLKDAIRRYPDVQKLYDELGNLYFHKGLYDEAAGCYRETLSFDNYNCDIIFKLAYCHLISRDFEQAEHYFDMISGIIPEASYNRCVALYKLNQGFEAIELLEELIAESDYSPKPYILLGKLYLEYERYDKIFRLIERSEKIFGKVDELSFVRGAAYFHTRQWLKAFVDFMDAESTLTETPTFFRMYALTCEKIGKTDKAVEILKQSIEKFPLFHGAYYDLIKIYIMYNHYSEALRVVDRLYKMGITLFDISGSEGKLFDNVFRSLKKKSEE
jgi:tetratricopeptide (TPR) repeat protein